LKVLECTLRHGYPMQPYSLILPTVVNLYIYEDLGWPPHGIRNSNTQWLAFLRLFTAVENLITYPEIYTINRARYARACWGQNNRSLARPSEHHRDLSRKTVRSGVTTLWPPDDRFLWDIGSKFGLT
jgi:hypothetical protein